MFVLEILRRFSGFCLEFIMLNMGGKDLQILILRGE